MTVGSAITDTWRRACVERLGPTAHAQYCSTQWRIHALRSAHSPTVATLRYHSQSLSLRIDYKCYLLESIKKYILYRYSKVSKYRRRVSIASTSIYIGRSVGFVIRFQLSKSVRSALNEQVIFLKDYQVIETFSESQQQTKLITRIYLLNNV